MRSALGLSHWCSLLLLLSLVTAPRGLEVGDLFSQGKPPAVKQDCSRTCESKFCTVPPVLRYGKYCGILYSGCPGEKPCDALDACCMVHDHCVAANNNDYLNTRCNENLLGCLDGVNPAGPTFPGNKCGVGETAFVIKGVIEAAVLPRKKKKKIEAAVLAGKILHKRDIGQ